MQNRVYSIHDKGSRILFTRTAGTEEGASGGKERDTIGPQGGSGVCALGLCRICAGSVPWICSGICSGIRLPDKQVF